MLCVETSNWLKGHRKVGHKVGCTMLTFSVFGITAPVKAYADMVWSTQVVVITLTERSQKE